MVPKFGKGRYKAHNKNAVLDHGSLETEHTQSSTRNKISINPWPTIRQIFHQNFRNITDDLKYSVLAVVGLITLIFIWISNTDLPSFEDLENPKYDLASVIYDAKGTPFRRYYIEDRGGYFLHEQLSENVKNALIVTEDDRFYSHSGIDVRALIRVGFRSGDSQTRKCRWRQCISQS